MKKPARILLVEDDPNDEILTLRTLAKAQANAEVVVMRDGEQALDYLLSDRPYRSGEIFRLPEHILLDLQLPKISGLEVLQQIKANELTKRIPVTMLTGSDNEIIVGEVTRHGAEACVLKPISCEMLRQIVGNCERLRQV